MTYFGQYPFAMGKVQKWPGVNQSLVNHGKVEFRMEFEKGYSFCRSFQLPDPCEHLWCAHQETPLLCKTKKGPPMDGTACGREKVKTFYVVKK